MYHNLFLLFNKKLFLFQCHPWINGNERVSGNKITNGVGIAFTYRFFFYLTYACTLCAAHSKQKPNVRVIAIHASIPLISVAVMY